MVARDNLNDSELIALKRRVEKLERGAPLGFSSITRGGLRIASPEGLTIQAVGGGVAMRVTGTEQVDGTLNVSGQLNLSGTQTVTGHLVVSGDQAITGPLTVQGNTDMSGNLHLTGALNVDGTGRINIGSTLVLTPAANGGTIDFGSGRSIYSSTGVLGIYNSAAVGVVLNTAANLVGPGCSFIAAAAPRINGLPTINRTTIGSPPVGTVYADATGALFRAV